MKDSIWSEQSIKNSDASSYYDYGCLDTFDTKLEAEHFNKLVEKESICLDLAAGSGRFSSLLLDKNCKVTAVDLERKHTDFLKKRFEGKNITVILDDAVKFVEESDKTFDLIVVSGLLLFLEDQATLAFIKNTKRILKSGGSIIIRDFLAKPPGLVIDSRIFPNTKLYYRPKSFYSELGASEFKICRYRHKFPKLEKFVFGFLGYPIYRFLFQFESMRKLIWIGSKTKNYIFTIK